MPYRDRDVKERLPGFARGAIALAIVVAAASPAAAETVDGPTFLRGLWRFARTLEYPDAKIPPRRDEMKRCVDPTNAMKGIFSSPDIGNCRSTGAERVDNRYTFANRCDYMGPVTTQITVYSEHAYTELNVSKAGNFRAVDKVVAQRIGDCDSSD